MFLRVFFLARTFINYGTYTDAYSRKLCNSYGFTAGVRFTFKVHMVTNPGRSAVTILSCSILFLSLLLEIFERPYSLVNDNLLAVNTFGGGFWLITMTITTVGYGDVSPQTIMGKVIAIATALWGSFLISIFVLTTASLFDLTKPQMQAMRHISLSRSASKTIVSAMKYFVKKKKYYELLARVCPDNLEHSAFITSLDQQLVTKKYNRDEGFRSSSIMATLPAFEEPDEKNLEAKLKNLVTEMNILFI